MMARKALCAVWAALAATAVLAGTGATAETQPFTIEKVTLEVVGSAGDARPSVVVVPPAKLESELVVPERSALTARVSIGVASVNRTKPDVHQVSLLLVSTADALVEAVVPLMPAKGAKGVYAGKLDLGKRSTLEGLRGRPGAFELAVVAGGFGDGVRGAEARLGVAQLRFAAFDWAPGSRSRTVPDYHFAARPDQDHVFRAPERRLPAWLSLAAAGACVAPWLGLLVAWGIFGANLRGFAWSPVPLLANVVFLGCLVGYVALYYLYFVRLNLFQTLAGVLLLAVPTMVSGRAALRHHARVVPRVSGSAKRKAA